MSRAIDRLPTPTQIRKKEIIVIARSRTGTLSVWQALNILGYRTYHGAEVIANGSSHIDVFEEALNAKYYGIGKPYGKAEFEKWFANYDALVEIPAVFLEEIVACYPDAKFIHIERDVDGWYKSVMNTLAESFKAVDRWPLRQLRLVDSFVDKFCKFHLLVYRLWWHGRALEDGEEVLKKDYNELNRAVKEILPKEKLNSFRLEDGFGWEQLCSVLEKPVPAVPYPRANTPERFDKMQAGFVQKAMRKAVGLAVTTVFVPAAAVAGWYYLRHVRS